MFSSAVPGAATANQESDITFPVLTSALADSVDRSAIVVRGERFSAGGEVFVAVHDPWAEQSYEARWTTASTVTFDMLGHADPELGYRPGGVVNEMFDGLCGQLVMVRAFDQQSDTWSNLLDVAIQCS